LPPTSWCAGAAAVTASVARGCSHAGRSRPRASSPTSSNSGAGLHPAMLRTVDSDLAPVPYPVDGLFPWSSGRAWHRATECWQVGDTGSLRPSHRQHGNAMQPAPRGPRRSRSSRSTGGASSAASPRFSAARPLDCHPPDPGRPIRLPGVLIGVVGGDQASGGGLAPRLDHQLAELGRVALTLASRPSSERAANILSRTRKVGWPQVSRSSASGSDSTTRRSSSAVIISSPLARPLDVDRQCEASMANGTAARPRPGPGRRSPPGRLEPGRRG
jgi:hypothetical protein